MATASRQLQPGASDRSPGVREGLGSASASSPPQEPLAPRPSWKRRAAGAGLRRAARDKPPRAAAAAGRRGGPARRPERGGLEAWATRAAEGARVGIAALGGRSRALAAAAAAAAAAVRVRSRDVRGGPCAPVLPGGQRWACTEDPGKGSAAVLGRRVRPCKCLGDFSRRIIARRRCQPEKQRWM